MLLCRLDGKFESFCCITTLNMFAARSHQFPILLGSDLVMTSMLLFSLALLLQVVRFARFPFHQVRRLLSNRCSSREKEIQLGMLTKSCSRRATSRTGFDIAGHVVAS